MAARLCAKIKFLPISSLKLYARNPRTHSPKQIRQVADSIKQFGFVNPILVDADGRVIAGHGRLKAAQLLGMEGVPTIRLDHDRCLKARVHHRRQQAGRKCRLGHQAIGARIRVYVGVQSRL